MTKEMIISSSAHETRVAILEEDQVAEIFIERERPRGVVGNLYKGRVSKVLPGMQSAFVDLGLERDGFLYVSDVIATFEEFDRLETDDDDAPPAVAADEARADRTGAARQGGARREAAGAGRRAIAREKGPEPKIEELLKEGQEIIVQVAKEPLGTKGARLTSHATMPGRFLVFMPTVDHVGVSRKIESRDERSRLRGIVREFREQHGFGGGVIIRTAAAGRPKEDIVSDLSYFHRVWTEIRQKADTLARPGRRLPGAEPGRQAAARPAHRGVLGHPHRQRAGVPPRPRADRAHHAVARAEGEALREGVPDLRGVRRPGRDRQGAAQQGVAEVGRLDRHQPDRGAGRDRRQHRPLRRQEDGGPARGHHPQDQPRSGEGDRAADPAARSRRHHRPRLHRHGGEEEPAEGLPDGGAGAAQGPRAVARRCRCRTSGWSSSRASA